MYILILIKNVNLQLFILFIYYHPFLCGYYSIRLEMSDADRN